ncbi:MAG: hypothetical protein KatS3mg105_0040 [Gemmatales bacterium]|nr:MAG: hypothetical protein KatS3mg105_0040 [Gemmatales bacterium]
MRNLLCLCLFLVPAVDAAADSDWVQLSDSFDHWQKPLGDWIEVKSVRLDADNPRRFVFEKGKGIWLNGPNGRTRNLVTKQNHADVEVQFDFNIPKRSNSGVKFMGVYEIQILDSFGKKELTGSDCGGVYPRAEMKPRYHTIDKGVPPRVNACKAPGEWQTLHVVFRAPRFDENGKKIANARFDKVVLNGVVIHENVEVPYPTGHIWNKVKEKATGPLLLQADHGPVAFRNIRWRQLSTEGKK